MSNIIIVVTFSILVPILLGVVLKHVLINHMKTANGSMGNIPLLWREHVYMSDSFDDLVSIYDAYTIEAFKMLTKINIFQCVPLVNSSGKEFLAVIYDNKYGISEALLLHEIGHKLTLNAKFFAFLTKTMLVVDIALVLSMFTFLWSPIPTIICLVVTALLAIINIVNDYKANTITKIWSHKIVHGMYCISIVRAAMFVGLSLYLLKYYAIF